MPFTAVQRRAHSSEWDYRTDTLRREGSAQHCAEAQCLSRQCNAEPTLQSGITGRIPFDVRVSPVTDRVDRDVADVARKWVPDPRLGVLEVTVEPERLAGCTTSRDALAALRRIAADAGRAADIRLLPDTSVRDAPAAVVTAAVAPLLREPRIAADRVSEALHGEPLALLERREEGGVWVRVRAGDGYHAWTHVGYLAVGPSAWADDWSRRATVRSLRAELRFEDQRLRLAVGARVALRRNGQVETADGRAGSVRSEEHTSELQSLAYLVCRLLLEKKK